MKELIITLILLVTVLALVCANAIYTERITSQLKDLATKAKDSASEEALSALWDHWDTHKDLLSMSVGLRYIDSITENLLSLKIAIEENDRQRAEQGFALFCNALEDIRRFERLSFGVIF